VSWKEVLPFFKRSEDHWRGGDAHHGQGGELRVEQQRLRWDILDRFADALMRPVFPEPPTSILGQHRFRQIRGDAATRCPLEMRSRRFCGLCASDPTCAS